MSHRKLKPPFYKKATARATNLQTMDDQHVKGVTQKGIRLLRGMKRGDLVDELMEFMGKVPTPTRDEFLKALEEKIATATREAAK